MTRSLLAALSLALAVGLLSPADALGKQCRNAKGKFIKCAPAASAPLRCKDAKGKFAKCGTPGAKPVH